MKNIFLTAIFLIGVSQLAGAQSSVSNCKTNLLNYTKTMSSMREPVGDQVYRMSYSVETLHKPGKSQSATKFVKADILVGKDKSFYETDVMSMYADNKNGFLVLPMQKKIIWGPGGKSLGSEKNFDALSGFQDSLIQYSRVVGCRMIDDKEEKLQETVLDPPQEVKDKMRVKRIIMLFATEKKIVRKVVIEYDDRSELSQTIVAYKNIDFDYNDNLSETAYEKIFTKNGKPRSAYKDYEIVDNRKTD